MNEEENCCKSDQNSSQSEKVKGEMWKSDIKGKFFRKQFLLLKERWISQHTTSTHFVDS